MFATTLRRLAVVPVVLVIMLATVSVTFASASSTVQWPFTPYNGAGSSHGESVTVVPASQGSRVGLEITWKGGYYKGYAFGETLTLVSKAAPWPSYKVTQIHKSTGYKLHKASSTSFFVPLVPGYEYFGCVTLSLGAVDFGGATKFVYFELPIVKPLTAPTSTTTTTTNPTAVNVTVSIGGTLTDHLTGDLAAKMLHYQVTKGKLVAINATTTLKDAQGNPAQLTWKFNPNAQGQLAGVMFVTDRSMNILRQPFAYDASATITKANHLTGHALGYTTRNGNAKAKVTVNWNIALK